MASASLVEVAGGMAAGGDLPQRRRLEAAALHRMGTAGMEVTTGGRVEGRGYLALHRLEAAPALIESWDLGEKRLGIGMVRLPEQLLGGRALDDAAQVHDQDAVGDVLDDAEVVADEEIGQVQLLAEPDEEIDDLRLDRDVEGRHRLVADDELRVDRQRPGDADALPLAAGELGRIARLVAGIEADAAERVVEGAIEIAARHQPMHPRRLAHDLPHLEARIERGEWILEDHLGAE